jgi:anti-anti-sigma factor
MATRAELDEVRAERRGDVGVLRLLGEHDMGNVGLLRRAIAAHIEADEGVVVSLVDTQFIDATVVRTLFDGDQELRARGRRLSLHVATEDVVRRVLEITGLTDDLPATGSLEDALAAAARGETG